MWVHPVMVEGNRIRQALAEYERKFEFARRIILPVEERAKLFPRAVWTPSSYRWFKSENIIDLVKLRQLRNAGKL
jgi:hypothetical protein